MIGGNAALDFVNTVSSWRSEPVDRLGGPEAFAEWAEHAGLVDVSGRKQLTAAIKKEPEQATRFYERASTLRSALWRIFTAVTDEQKPASGDLAILNEEVRRAAALSEIAATGTGFDQRWVSDAPAMETLIATIARAAERLLRDGPLDRIHSCGGETCEWMFVDLSKNGKRRWCSMATCGNEAKVKKFRKRKKKAA